MKELLLSSHYLPMLVNAAFTIELFLRSILVFEGKEPGSKHNIYVMFTRIERKTQILVRRTITLNSDKCCSFNPTIP